MDSYRKILTFPTEVYASPNPDSDILLVVSENVKVESIKYSEKLGGCAIRSGRLVYPATPEKEEWEF